MPRFIVGDAVTIDIDGCGIPFYPIIDTENDDAEPVLHRYRTFAKEAATRYNTMASPDA